MKKILSIATLSAATLSAQAQTAATTQQHAVQNNVATTVGVARLGGQDALTAGVLVWETIMIHVDGAASEMDRALLASLGIVVGEKGYVIVTAATYQALLEEYQQRVSANTMGIKWVINAPLPGVDHTSLEVRHGKANSQHLRTEVSEYSFTVQDVLAIASRTNGGTLYRTRTTTTRTDVTDTTNHDFHGGNTTSATLSATGHVGPNTTVTGSVTRNKNQFPWLNPQSNTSIAASLIHYMPQAWANISTGFSKNISNNGDKSPIIALEFQTKVTNALVFTATVAGTSKNDMGGYLGVNYYYWDGEAPNPGVAPSTVARKMRDDMLAMNAAWYAMNPLSTSLVIKSKTTTKKETVSVDESSQFVADPKTPETPIDKEAPVITLKGTAIVTLTVGNTYTEPGATCVDNKDTTCTVVVSGTVNTAVVGTYTVTYTATDSAGNKSVKTRTVNVTTLPDKPTTVTLDMNNITSDSATALCNIEDLDDAQGTCTVYDVDSNDSIVTNWNISSTPFSLAGLLKPLRNYRIVLNGTAKDGSTGQYVAVQRTRNFQTVCPAGTAPDGTWYCV